MARLVVRFVDGQRLDVGLHIVGALLVALGDAGRALRLQAVRGERERGLWLLVLHLRGMLGFFQLVEDLLESAVVVLVPVDRVDTHDAPLQHLEHRGLHDLAVAGGLRLVVVAAIAEDAEDVVIGVVGS